MWRIGFQTIGDGNQDDDRDRYRREVLLVFKVPIGSQEDVELETRHGQQLAVPHALPTALGNGCHVQPW